MIIEDKEMAKRLGRLPITHVAVRYEGKVYSLPEPNRHHDVIRHIAEVNGTGNKPLVGIYGDNQGFLDESGRYLIRKAALLNAKLNGQLKGPQKEIIGGELYSENLW